MRKLIAVVSSWLILLFFFIGPPTAEAVNALPPGMVIGDSEGLYATSEGEYYIDLVDLLPGEIYEKEITIRSLDLEEPFSLGLLVEEVESKGSIDWKEHIVVRLELDGEKIYDGPLLGDGSFDWTQTPLKLGVCNYGTDKVMKATFTVDSGLTNEDYRDQSHLYYYWTFVAVKDQQPAEPDDPTKPQEPVSPAEPSTSTTGELPRTMAAADAADSGKRLPQTGEQLVYQFLSGLLLVLIALFLWRKRREEEQR